MQTYLVGGAVRDELLGLAVNERDWVVVGATPEQMGAAGYRAVGKDFPVFLHPRTGEEYALARTERKSGRGYHGFTFHTGADVTLEADLARRDLTINAMARDADGQLIDPYGGQRDLAARCLRHVSPAFVEDPVRILRVARFYARFAPLGFTVAQQTRGLMQQMVANGEVDQLVPERVWAETARSLALPAPQQFFALLREVGALARLFPEVDALFGIPQPAQHHPEVDTGVHTLLALEQAARLEAPPEVGFAVLCHDLGKARTPASGWPSHHGHERLGLVPARRLCERLRVPRAWRELALLVTQWHLHVHRAFELRAPTLVKLLEAADAFRRPQRLDALLTACEADARGREGLVDRDYPQAAYVRRAADAARAVDAAALAADGLQGSQIAQALRKLRIAAIRQASKVRN